MSHLSLKYVTGQTKKLSHLRMSDRASHHSVTTESETLAQLQKPGYPKSGGVLLDGTLKINPDVGKGANFCVNADFMVVQQ